VLKELKRLEEAIANYEMVLTLNPNYLFIKGDIIHTMMYGNKWDKVSEIYKEKMEDNNYRGFFTINGLELDDPGLQNLVQRMLKDETRQMVVKYNDILTTAQKMGSGASSAVRGGMSKAISNESLRRRNRLR
jgi:hypothetical protein